MRSLDALLATEALSMREKLFQYWHLWENYQHSEDASKHCLIVKLSAEIADISEDMRELLAQMTTRVEKRLGDIIEAGIKDGSMAPKLEARMAAQVLYQMWLGASLIGKVTRDKKPLQKALEVTEIMLPAA
ncbi:TetR family transcriptional regulator C-terminal domain-containing protein [Pseudovibrio ascidiaceicola]|nr:MULTISPECIES: TetR family transcriptional regulator C-terminal domain-containing protein [Pseudovibrio]